MVSVLPMHQPRHLAGMSITFLLAHSIVFSPYPAKTLPFSVPKFPNISIRVNSLFSKKIPSSISLSLYFKPLWFSSVLLTPILSLLHKWPCFQHHRRNEAYTAGSCLIIYPARINPTILHFIVLKDVFLYKANSALSAFHRIVLHSNVTTVLLILYHFSLFFFISFFSTT